MRDTWWFCLFYSITFGGFVGLASFLNVFFLSQYGLSRVQAGNFTTLCVVAGSFLRPLGGYLADRLGGVRMLTLVYLGVGAVALGLTSLPPLAGCDSALVRGDGALGNGQRRRLPACAEPVPQGDRCHDRASSAPPEASGASCCPTCWAA